MPLSLERPITAVVVTVIAATAVVTVVVTVVATVVATVVVVIFATTVCKLLRSYKLRGLMRCCFKALLRFNYAIG